MWQWLLYRSAILDVSHHLIYSLGPEPKRTIFMQIYSTLLSTVILKCHMFYTDQQNNNSSFVTFPGVIRDLQKQCFISFHLYSKYCHLQIIRAVCEKA